MSKKQIRDLVIDYKLWIALIEQYLIDNYITAKDVYTKLNSIKQQLAQLGSISAIDIYKQIQLIDNSLQTIQQQLSANNHLQTSS